MEWFGVIEERDLIIQAQRGDAEAFRQLVGRYHRRLHLLALRYCRNCSDAEDLSQEVWIKVHRSLKTFRGDSGFYTWLRQITVRTFLNSKRGGALQTDNLEQLYADEYEINHAVFEQQIDVTDQLHHKLLLQKIRGFLDTLTPTQRLVFLLKHDEGMTCEEIAGALECSSGTVKKTLFRTVARLREAFAGEFAASKL